MMQRDGFVTVADARAAAASPRRLGAFLFWMRVLVSHAAMLRLCEAEDGMRVSDVSFTPTSHGGFFALRAGYIEPDVVPFEAYNRKLLGIETKIISVDVSPLVYASARRRPA